MGFFEGFSGFGPIGALVGFGIDQAQDAENRQPRAGPVRRAEFELLRVRGESSEGLTDRQQLANIAQAERELFQAQEQQRNRLALRPAAQLTREPVPLPPLAPEPGAGQPVVARPAPQLTREPVPVESEEDEMANGFELIPFLSGVSNVLGSAAGLANVLRPPPIASPASFSAMPPIVRSIGGGVLGGAAGGAVGGFLGGGGGNGTPLSRARTQDGRRVTRKMVFAGVRGCGIALTSQSFGLSELEVCSIVSKGMPRRGRGISAADMRRTRSTISKISNMQRALKPLCGTTARRRRT